METVKAVALIGALVLLIAALFLLLGSWVGKRLRKMQPTEGDQR